MVTRWFPFFKYMLLLLAIGYETLRIGRQATLIWPTVCGLRLAGTLPARNSNPIIPRMSAIAGSENEQVVVVKD